MAGGNADTVLGVRTELEPWETSAPGPFVTIRAGGPFDAVVTITAVTTGRGRNRVEASWEQDGQQCSQSLEAASYSIARAIAHAAARQFALGNQPTLTRG